MNELKLSKKSESFLENLGLYLFSSGKNQAEIKEIMNELEVHLFEAEKNGKSIEKIIGASPKEYMETISDEMISETGEWTKYLVSIVFGALTIKILYDLLVGNLSYSILEIIGYPLIGVIFMINIISVFKYMTTTNQSVSRKRLVIGARTILPFILLISLIYLNRVVSTPIIDFSNQESLMGGVVVAGFLIIFSILAKNWTLILIICLLILPDFLLNLTSLQSEAQLTLSIIIMLGGIGIYLWIVSQVEKVRD